MAAALARQRLFFALWPDPATRAALLRRQAGVHGTATAPDQLHLTLAFLGWQPAAALPALRALLEQVPAAPLALELDTWGHFGGPRIAWAGMRAAPPALLALQAELVRRLTAQQLLPPQSAPFRPHVTLARHADAAPTAPFAPLRWLAGEMVLAESSGTGAPYRMVATRRLA
jgi:2'-5' RNA ligase